MFKKDLQERLERIFQLRKTTLSAPSDDFEQDTLFVEINEARAKVYSGRIRARVTGVLIVYAQVSKLPYGYFQKKIELAELSDKSPFFFYEIDNDVASSPSRIQNIHERRINFTYVHEMQFDPSKGKLEYLNMECC